MELDIIVFTQYPGDKTLTGKLQIRILGLSAVARLWQAGVSLLYCP